MPRWLRVLVILGVVFDLFISGWLWHNQAKSDCWSGVLDRAVSIQHHTTSQQKAALYRQAQGCRSVSWLP